MEVLVTGAFGNIGKRVLDELLLRGHSLTCFDTLTKRNKRASRKYRDKVKIVWGDIRDKKIISSIMVGIDAVVHLAYLIPKLSVTGMESEDKPDLAEEINVGGTKNIIEACEMSPHPPKLLFTSSLHIYGRTQDQPPPRHKTEKPRPVEHYAKHKVISEHDIMTSSLTWVILRLAASLPTRLILDKAMFDIPLNNRIEFVHSKDVAMAIANALENEKAWGKVWHIGGGKRCQLYQREMLQPILESIGIGMLPEEAFSNVPYPTDWLETEDSQKVLFYQRHTLQDYIHELNQKLGRGKVFIWLASPLIRYWLLSYSPFYKVFQG